jgi:uncharacterized protein (TIGR02266 family)
MPGSSFVVAFIWESPTTADTAAKTIESLLDGFDPRQVGISVVRRPNLVTLQLVLDFSLYSRGMLTKLQALGQQSGGHFVELLRIPEEQREAFSRQFLTPVQGEAETFDSFIVAARTVRAHLAGLGVAPLIEPPPPRASPSASAASGKPQLRATPRHDVVLELQFNTAAELAKEYATNISRGGLFIRTKLRPKLNTQALLSLSLPNGEVLRVIVRVVHVMDHPEHGGVGVAFEPGDDSFSVGLERYLDSLPKA